MEFTPKFRKIGKGECGTVWAISTRKCTFVVKVQNGMSKRSIHDEWKAYELLLDISDKLPVRICRFSNMISPTDGFWTSTQHLFPPGDYLRSAFFMEIIRPFPKRIRECIYHHYADSSSKSTESKVSLEHNLTPFHLRLGERNTSRTVCTSLRDFPLCSNRIEGLVGGSNISEYVIVLARTLAQCYWLAHMDLAGVKFALAPNHKNKLLDTSSVREFPATRNPCLSKHFIWMYSFGACKLFLPNAEGLHQTVIAFFNNAAYFPVPHPVNQEDEILWIVFRDAFLQESMKIRDDEILGRDDMQYLPLRWVKMVEYEGLKRKIARKSEGSAKYQDWLVEFSCGGKTAAGGDMGAIQVVNIMDDKCREQESTSCYIGEIPFRKKKNCRDEMVAVGIDLDTA